MSALPEAEVLRRDLDKELVGKKIKEVWVSPAELVRRHGTIKDFAATLEDRKVVGAERRGTVVLLGLDGDDTLVLIPGTRCRVTRESATADRAEHTRMVATFTTGGSIHYQDLEADGQLFVIPTEEVEGLPELQALGLDPLAEPIPWPVLAQQLTARREMLKQILLDETFVVGLGDVYTDEILFEAGLSPTRTPDTLSSQELRRLHRAILEVLYEAIKQGGVDAPVSEKDPSFAPYREIDFLKVYDREGEPDARSRQPITHAEVADGIWAYWSPNSQT